MKVIYLFLAFSIFVQAKSLCVPGACHSKKDNQEEICSSLEEKGHGTCCHAKHDKKQSEDNSCDDDSCHCLGCIKVFVTTPAFYFDQTEWADQPEAKNELKPDVLSGLDYIFDFYHPPQVLAYL